MSGSGDVTAPAAADEADAAAARAGWVSVDAECSTAPRATETKDAALRVANASMLDGEGGRTKEKGSERRKRNTRERKEDHTRSAKEGGSSNTTRRPQQRNARARGHAIIVADATDPTGPLIQPSSTHTRTSRSR